MWGSEKGSEGVVELARLGNAVRGQAGRVANMGTVPIPRQRRSVHLELDRQWGRWGYIGTAPCSAEFSER